LNSSIELRVVLGNGHIVFSFCKRFIHVGFRHSFQLSDHTSVISKDAYKIFKALRLNLNITLLTFQLKRPTLFLYVCSALSESRFVIYHVLKIFLSKTATAPKPSPNAFMSAVVSALPLKTERWFFHVCALRLCGLHHWSKESQHVLAKPPGKYLKGRINPPAAWSYVLRESLCEKHVCCERIKTTRRKFHVCVLCARLKKV